MMQLGGRRRCRRGRGRAALPRLRAAVASRAARSPALLLASADFI